MPDLTAGWEIIILGTGTVFAVLIILGLLVTVLQRIFGPRTAFPASTEKPDPSPEPTEEIPVAAIAAAVHAFRGAGEFRIVRIRHRGDEWARRGRQELVNNKPEWKGS